MIGSLLPVGWLLQKTKLSFKIKPNCENLAIELHNKSIDLVDALLIREAKMWKKLESKYYEPVDFRHCCCLELVEDKGPTLSDSQKSFP